uniref:IRG-type G domain-containing protein n=1 Tax=Alexandrium monilatum TaxID=311494 RepID=A0A7S4WC96_9DINO|mmetsp:Transcript_19353/g.61356  ORF Transcript_19353/g.61356 Transcript_19353/m.61356 type:complete len:605 (-) Transcript_19353:69-1883(-)
MAVSGGAPIYAHYVFNNEDGSWYEPSKWEEHWSESWQCPCYYNIETGEMVWSLSKGCAEAIAGAQGSSALADTEASAQELCPLSAAPVASPVAEAPGSTEAADVGIRVVGKEPEVDCDTWIAEDIPLADGSSLEASERPTVACRGAGGSRKSQDLSSVLAQRFAHLESTAQTFESQPVASSADAGHLQGLRFDAPPAHDWLRQFADPEEDRVGEVLACDLEERGPRPAHAPHGGTPEEQARLAELTQMVWSLREQLSAERQHAREQGMRAEALARREAELLAQERALEEECQQYRARALEKKSYPPPPWLPEPDGTINVGVVGNSGVGKSLLINQLRGLSHGMDGWAPVGINETTVKVSMYAFPSEHRVRLWDFPGAGTPDLPLGTYVARMGLRYLDKVLIVTAGRFTETEMELRGHLRECHVPHCMVRTKVDIDVWNNRHDNGVVEEISIREMRYDMRENHGIDDAFLVSLRDTGAHDFPRLLSSVFPCLGALRDGSSEVQGWDSAWAILEVHSELISAIQGRWKDKQGTMYIVQGLQVHVTAAAGGTSQSATAILSEVDSRVYWLGRWTVNAEAVARSRRKGELRWAACEDKLRDMVWKWHD